MIENENLAPISDNSTQQEFTEIDIDKSIGGISQDKVSRKSNRSGVVKSKKKSMVADNSASIKLREKLVGQKSPDILNDNKTLA